MKMQSLVIGLLILFYSAPSIAQKRWTAEFRPGVNFPTQELGNASPKRGFGFEATFSYEINPRLSAYTGWGWNLFTANEFYDQENLDFEETGFSLGLKFNNRFRETPLFYMIGAGLVYNHLELETRDGNLVHDTGHEPGWQAEAGVGLDLGNGFRVRPQVRYRSLAFTTEIADVEYDLDLQYLSFGLSFALKF